MNGNAVCLSSFIAAATVNKNTEQQINVDCFQNL
jgi:hypothetical protein